MIRTRHLHAVGADVLRDSSRLARCHLRGADCVQQGSLAVIDVAHHGYHRSARQLNVVRVGGDQFLEFLFGYHFLKRNERDFIAEALTQLDRDVVVQRLIDGSENLALQQEGHHVLRLDSQFFCEFFDCRAFNYAHGFQFAWSRGRFHSSSYAIFKRQSFRRRNKVALIKAAGFTLNLSSAARGRAARAAPACIRRRDVCGLRSGCFPWRAQAFGSGERRPFPNPCPGTLDPLPRSYGGRYYWRRSTFAGANPRVESRNSGPQNSNLARRRRNARWASHRYS